MRISVPGLKGLYYDTDAESPAVTIALTAAGRRAPKPQGYAVQLLPYLWSFDVDLREVPNDHPIQYLHPEGARSLGELSADRSVRRAGDDLESILRFVWAVNEQVESAAGRLVGRERDPGGRVVEIEDGAVAVDGEELETDAFDVDDGSSSVTTIEIQEGPIDESVDEASDVDAFDVDEPGRDAVDEKQPTHDRFDPDERSGSTRTDDAESSGPTDDESDER